MELSQYLRILRAHWKLIWAGFLVGIGLAGVVTLLITPVYASTAKLFVTDSGADSTTSVQGNVVAQSRVISYAEVISTESFLRQVIADSGVDITPGELAGQVAPEIASDTTVILGITVSNPSPDEAQLLVTTIANNMVEYIKVLETPEATVTETDVTGTTTVTPSAPFKATVIQNGGSPTAPVTPDPVLLLPLGGLLGLLIGFLLALMRHLLDNTVKTSKQVEELTGSSAVGGVLFDPSMAGRPLASQFNAHSMTGEAYRQIRTNLQYVSVDAPPRVLVVTSSVSGEGKTTTAVNLALVLAQSGQRVALVEADLRRPRIMRYLRMVGGAGLTNVLAGNADLSELLQPYGDGKLSVLAAGPHPPNPSELLGSDHMGRLLGELRDSHDFVIVDAPPLLPVTDAAVLAVLADGAVIVTRYGSTKREQLRAAADLLHGIDARIVGTVLNMVSPKGGGDYGYGYGYGYQYEPDPNPRDEPVGGEGRRRSAAGRGRTTAERTGERTATPAGENAAAPTGDSTAAPAGDSTATPPDEGTVTTAERDSAESKS